jgi:hypothetical protein
MFPSAIRPFADRARARLFPGPFAAAGVALALFLGVSLVSRIGLALFNGKLYGGTLPLAQVLVPESR